jgi:2-dehydropantoate 2-reductase
MKILMFSRGVIASIYGWALQKAGHDVEFYVRPGRAQQYGSTLSMKLYDLRSKMTGTLIQESWMPRLREDIAADHNYDLIILSVQHYHFVEAAALVASRVGNATVLIFNNFWNEPRAEAAALPASQLVWGFPHAGGGFDEQGRLQGSLLPSVLLGTFGTPPTDRHVAVQQMFRNAGFGLKEERDFRGWLLIHFAGNAGLLSELLRMGSPKALIHSVSALRQSLLNSRELIPLLEARGVDLSLHWKEVALFRLPSLPMALLLSLTLRFFSPLRLVMESHSNKEELRRICRDVLDEARRIRIAVPRLEALESFFGSTHEQP